MAQIFKGQIHKSLFYGAPFITTQDIVQNIHQFHMVKLHKIVALLLPFLIQWEPQEHGK